MTGPRVRGGAGWRCRAAVIEVTLSDTTEPGPGGPDHASAQAVVWAGREPRSRGSAQLPDAAVGCARLSLRPLARPGALERLVVVHVHLRPAAAKLTAADVEATPLVHVTQKPVVAVLPRLGGVGDQQDEGSARHVFACRSLGEQRPALVASQLGGVNADDPHIASRATLELDLDGVAVDDPDDPSLLAQGGGSRVWWSATTTPATAAGAVVARARVGLARDAVAVGVEPVGVAPGAAVVEEEPLGGRLRGEVAAVPVAPRRETAWPAACAGPAVEVMAAPLKATASANRRERESVGSCAQSSEDGIGELAGRTLDPSG